MTTSPVKETRIAGLKLFRRGKVRDLYDLGDKLLIVATDRLSAFDCVLPDPIPEKGRVLTQASAFWFKKTAGIVPNHFITADFSRIRRELPASVELDEALYDGRLMLVRKAERIDAECVVRGYLAGSGFKEYLQTGSVCGQSLPSGLKLASALPRPLFTPATKSDQGHDENISREALSRMLTAPLAAELERLSFLLYRFASDYLKARGLILADTKFEFGRLGDELIVIDEMLTPDSSRFWKASSYRPGSSPAGFDKQYVRDYLEKNKWDKKPPIPSLPSEVIEGTTRRYREFWKILSS